MHFYLLRHLYRLRQLEMRATLSANPQIRSPLQGHMLIFPHLPPAVFARRVLKYQAIRIKNRKIRFQGLIRRQIFRELPLCRSTILTTETRFRYNRVLPLFRKRNFRCFRFYRFLQQGLQATHPKFHHIRF